MSGSIQLDSKTAIKNVAGWTLLVQLDPVATESAGGIAFSETKVASDELAQTRGTVLDIGPFAWHDEPGPRCAVGDRIIFRQYQGEMLDVSGKVKYRIINDKDVYAVLERAE